jgi:hypothetical protein
MACVRPAMFVTIAQNTSTNLPASSDKSVDRLPTCDDFFALDGFVQRRGVVAQWAALGR